MNDDFLSQLREEPRADFRAALRRRIRSIDEEARSRRPGWWWMRAAAAACVACLAFVLLAFPSVRATARELLDLFRVQRFAAVSVDPERLARLENGEIDLKSILAENVEVLIEPDPPRTVADLAQASSFLGFSVQAPHELPEGFRMTDIRLHGLGKAQMRVDLERLKGLLEAMGVEDAQLPAELDGALIEITNPARAEIHYARSGKRINLIVSESPEIVYPSGLDLAALGETALRAGGLDREEARWLARTIDWRSTLVVPVPLGRASYREIELPTGRGLLLTWQVKKDAQSKGAPEWRSLLLQSRAGRLYALEGPGSGILLVRVAEAIK